MITEGKVDIACARPSKAQKVTAYNTSAIGKLPQYRSPSANIGMSELSARTNIIGACTTHDAMADAAG